MNTSLNAIVKNGLCHGCGGCAASLPAGRVSMALTDGGFLRPSAAPALDDRENAVVREVCSGLTLEHGKTDGEYHPLWGPIVASRVGASTDDELRFVGSSGGVLSSIVNYLITQKKVDFVIQISADEKDPIASTPRPSRSRDDVIAAAGSRYGPSSTLADLERHLASGARFAVVGKPCDIATLRRMARRDARIDQQVPIMLSFMCAGVPSRKGTMAVLDKLEAPYAQLTAFAYRGRGWPGYTRATLQSGEEKRMTYAASWGAILSRFLQPRCKICPDGTGEFADIVCADAWYGKDGYPDFSEAEGRSMILSRTMRGEALVSEMLTAEAIEAGPLDTAEIELMQPYQANRKRVATVRVAALKLQGRLTPRYRRLGLPGLTLKAGFMPLLRNFGGTFVRAAQGRFND